MPAIVNIGYFEIEDLDNSEANLGEIVTIAPLLHFKRNDGYGFNIGDCRYVPSTGIIYDNDVVDNSRWAPAFIPVWSVGT